MVFGIDSDPLLAAAFRIGVGALALAALLLAAVAVLRLRLNLRAAADRRFSAIWQPVLAACVDSGEIAAPALRPADGVRFLLLWLRLQESLRGEAQQRLVRLAGQVGADRVAVGYLASGNPRLELLALVALGHLRLLSVLPLAEALARSPSPAVSLAAAHVLLRTDAARELPAVVALAARREDWPLARLAAALRECPDESLDRAFSEALERFVAMPAGAPQLARLLRVLRVVRPQAARTAVLRALDRSASAEVLAAALHALWHPEDVRHARRLSSHSQWFVRVAAAKLLARLGDASDRDLLVKLLSDTNWWVRYRASGALARLPGVTPAELLRLRDSATDRYAADMLGQAIAELEHA